MYGRWGWMASHAEFRSMHIRLTYAVVRDVIG